MELRLIVKYPENKNVCIFLDLLCGLNVITRVLHSEEKREKSQSTREQCDGAGLMWSVLKMKDFKPVKADTSRICKIQQAGYACDQQREFACEIHLSIHPFIYSFKDDERLNSIYYIYFTNLIVSYIYIISTPHSSFQFLLCFTPLPLKSMTFS